MSSTNQPPVEHEIRLVAVEIRQPPMDSDSDSDVESVSSESSPSIIEEFVQEVQVKTITIPSSPIPVQRATTSSNTGDSKQISCLFCYNPVVKYITNKPYHRRILNNTCQRLFRYICDHLDIDFQKVPNRCAGKPSKESQLLPPYLPLCGRCRELYYNNIYESFVTYEAAVSKLVDQIAACITRTIGISAKQNVESVETDYGENHGDDLFDAYEKSMCEHEVMRAVKQFRQKVVEKNPAGYIEEKDPTAEGTKQRGGTRRGTRYGGTKESVTVESGDTAGNADESSTIRVGPDLKNVIKIVKNRRDILQRDKTNELVTNRLDTVKRDMYNENDGKEVSESGSSADLNYYAVSNPAPGVIQIIPVVVGENGEAIPSVPPPKPKKRTRSQREDYQKQRIALNTCKFCNRYFPGPSLLVRHQVLKHGMEKPEKCPHCDYRGINKASLKSHMETHLEGTEKEKAKKYACDVCGLKFKGKSGLNSHLRGHTGEKPFICDVCGKAFTSNTSRQLCLDKHNGLKHHKCAYCDKTFLRKEVLKIHERTHTGEKPFKCHVCGKAFAQRSPLNIHLKMHKKKDPSCSIKSDRYK